MVNMRKHCVYYANGKCLNKNSCEYKYQYFEKQQCRIGGLEKPRQRQVNDYGES